MLRVLLEEVLGYEDVVLVPDDSGLSVNDALLKLAGCDNHGYIYAAMYIVCLSKNGARKIKLPPTRNIM